MAAAFINFPMVYHQVPAHIKKDELDSVELDWVRTVRDSYNTFIGGGLHKPDHAMAIARTIALHYGFLPDGFAKEVTGVDTADTAKFGGIQKSIMTRSTYGKRSVRRTVPSPSPIGTCALQCDFAVPGETAEQRTSRQADAAMYRHAIASLQNMIRNAYKAAWREATAAINAPTTKNTDRFKWMQRRAFWEPKTRIDVQPIIADLPLLANPQELNSFKLLPLGYRAPEARQHFWDSKINPDILPTMFRLVTGTVDMVTLTARREYVEVWADKLSATMEILHVHVVAPQNMQTSLSARSTDPVFRASVDIKEDKVKALRNLVPVDRRGDWRDIPLLPAGT